MRVLLGAGRPLLSSGSLAFAPWCPERASSWPSPWDLLSVPAPPPRGSANSRGCRGLPLPPACSAPQLRAPSQAWAEVAACDAHWVSNPQRDPNSLSASPVTLLSEPREAPSRGEDAVNVFLTRWVPCFVRRAGGGPSARSRRRPERGATVRPSPCSLSQGPHGSAVDIALRMHFWKRKVKRGVVTPGGARGWGARHKGRADVADFANGQADVGRRWDSEAAAWGSARLVLGSRDSTPAPREAPPPPRGNSRCMWGFQGLRGGGWCV